MDSTYIKETRVIIDSPKLNYFWAVQNQMIMKE